jgi:protein-disulfide isomerase
MRTMTRSSLSFLGALGALAAVSACRGGDSGAGDSAMAALAAAGAPDTTDPRVRAADLARIMGDSAARVWLVIASDFQCPACKFWHDATAGAVVDAYVRTGKVRLAYVHFPLAKHPHAVPAAEASMCAGAQGKFWEFNVQVFRTQEAWALRDDATPVFDSLAASIGVDTAAYRKCLQDDVMIPMIQADRLRGQAAGVHSTPSFFVGSRLLSGAYPFKDMKPVIDAVIAEAAGPAR